MRPKAHYIGSPKIGAAIVKSRPDWDFGQSSSISEFEKKINQEEIDLDIQVVLILDNLFSVDPDKSKYFEQIIATLAPHCFVGVINYNPNNKHIIRERVQAESYVTGVEAPFYFISAKGFQVSLDSAIKQFTIDAAVDQARNVAILQGRDVDDVYEDAYTETDYTTLETDEEDESPFLGKIVAVTSSKGGSGKSTIALLLSTYLAHASISSAKEGLEERPLKILMLDLDIRDGQLGFLTGNTSPTVLDVIKEGEVTERTVTEGIIHSSRLKVDLMLAPRRPRQSEDYTTPEFYVELLQVLRKMYDYVILDTSVNYLDPLLEKVAYPLADQIVFVTDVVLNSIFSMTRWVKEIAFIPVSKGGTGINKSKIGIVVNKALKDINLTGEAISQASLKLPILTVVPSSPKLIAHAANMQAIEVVLKHDAIYKAIKRLANTVNAKSYKLSDNLNIS